jgi:hypothetical protein
METLGGTGGIAPAKHYNNKYIHFYNYKIPIKLKCKGHLSTKVINPERTFERKSKLALSAASNTAVMTSNIWTAQSVYRLQVYKMSAFVISQIQITVVPEHDYHTLLNIRKGSFITKKFVYNVQNLNF